MEKCSDVSSLKKAKKTHKEKKERKEKSEKKEKKRDKSDLQYREEVQKNKRKHDPTNSHDHESEHARKKARKEEESEKGEDSLTQSQKRKIRKERSLARQAGIEDPEHEERQQQLFEKGIEASEKRRVCELDHTEGGEGGDTKNRVYFCACGTRCEGFSAWRNHKKKSNRAKKFLEKQEMKELRGAKALKNKRPSASAFS
eukprot:Rmarinus@m.13915